MPPVSAISSAPASLVDPAFVANPFAQLAWLREHDPAHWDDALGTWFITRYEDVRRFFSDPRLSTDRRLARGYQPAPQDSWLFHFEQSSILSADPEGHRRWRQRRTRWERRSTNERRFRARPVRGRGPSARWLRGSRHRGPQCDRCPGS